MAKRSDPVLIVKLEKGLADRQRLPLAHVLSVLDELRQLVGEIGREVQRRRGLVNATGDFGLELIAGDKGLAFREGSVQAAIALTERAGTGVKVVQSIIDTVKLLDREDFLEESADRQIDRRIIRRLSRIAQIQRHDRTEMSLGIVKPGESNPISATFGSNAIATVRSLQAPTFHVHEAVLYGRLFHLLDRTNSENDEEERGFWGELHSDDGDTWRLQFKPHEERKVTPLFRERVVAKGTAVYYRIAHPKLICDTIEADKERDVDTAFDELFGCNRNIYRADLSTILKGIRGED